jgi:exonuclease III
MLSPYLCGMKRGAFFIFFILSVIAAMGQSSLRVMSYNLLNFPDGLIPNRIDTLEIILDYHRPDLFMIQELRNQSALEAIEDKLDSFGYGNFTTSSFVAGANDPLNQAIAFNQNKLRLKQQIEIPTVLRDINYFVLYLNDPELENGADTTFLHTFVCHLKAAEGNVNEQARLDMVQAALPYINALDDDSFVLFGGDFNVYTSAEPAFQALLNPSNSPDLVDPISTPGSWTNNGFFREVHTQSTRENVIFGDGAGGGMDDRFDHVLISEALEDPLARLHYVEGSYRALGNSGDCFNQSILVCAEENGLPAEVTSAIYHQSDHAPIVLELETAMNVGIIESEHMPLQARWNYSLGRPEVMCPYGWFRAEMWDISGRLIHSELLSSQAGIWNILSPGSPEMGIYLIRLTGEDWQGSTRVFCPSR